MGFGEQTEDRDLPHYIVVGTEHPCGGTGYYVATRAGLVRVTPVLYSQATAISLAEAYDRKVRATGSGLVPYPIWETEETEEVLIRDKGPEPKNLYGKPHPTQPGRSDVLGRGVKMEDLMYNDPVLEDEEPEYRRIKTPVEDAGYFIAGAGNVALGVEAPYPLNLSAEQTAQAASALLTFNLLGFRVRLERIHD